MHLSPLLSADFPQSAARISLKEAETNKTCGEAVKIEQLEKDNVWKELER